MSPKILYNKCPDILDEFRALIGRPRAPTAEERRAKILKEMEAAKKRAPEIQRTATVESPDSRDDSVDCTLEDKGMPDADDYVAKFMTDQKGRVASPPNKCESVADSQSCSVYMDASTINSPYSATAKAKMNGPPATMNDDNEDMDGLSMDYSMDTTDNKESFSSFARSNYTTSSHTMNDTATVVETINYPFSFLSKYDDISIGTNRSNGQQEPRIESESDIDIASVISEEEDYKAFNREYDDSGVSDISESRNHPNAIAKTPSPLVSALLRKVRTTGSRSTSVHSNISNQSGTQTTIVSTSTSNHSASKDSFSPLARRNVTFSSQLLDESSVLEYSRDGGKKTSGESILSKRKPRISIITNKSMLSLDEEEGLQPDQEGVDAAKEITPYTVSTAGMWSPSGSLTPHARDDMDLESLTSSVGYSLPSDESPYERKSAFSPVGQDVHVCKSASCTLCRCPSQNTPMFLSTQQPDTGKNYRLPRQLPSRWWDNQQSSYGQLKQFVASKLMQQEEGTKPDRTVEDHPFDEA